MKIFFIVSFSLFIFLACSKRSDTPEQVTVPTVALNASAESDDVRVVGNGGDYDSATFMQIGQDLLTYLKTSTDSKLKTIDLVKFERALKAEVIFIENSILVNDIPKVAANKPSENLILVHRPLWKKEKDPNTKVMIVFHEYLGLMGLDKKYEFSSYFLEQKDISAFIVLADNFLTNSLASNETETRYANCYKGLLKSVLQESRPDIKGEAMEELIVYQFISEKLVDLVIPANETLRMNRFKHASSLDQFFGWIWNGDSSLDVKKTKDTREYQQILNFCQSNASSAQNQNTNCESILIESLPKYFSSQSNIPKECNGILNREKDFTKNSNRDEFKGLSFDDSDNFQ